MGTLSKILGTTCASLTYSSTTAENSPKKVNWLFILLGFVPSGSGSSSLTNAKSVVISMELTLQAILGTTQIRERRRISCRSIYYFTNLIGGASTSSSVGGLTTFRKVQARKNCVNAVIKRSRMTQRCKAATCVPVSWQHCIKTTDLRLSMQLGRTQRKNTTKTLLTCSISRTRSSHCKINIRVNHKGLVVVPRSKSEPKTKRINN